MDNITILVSSSPIHSHPSTEVIDFTLSTIRERLPDSQIIIMQDGLRHEQEYFTDKYAQYLKNLAEKHPDVGIVYSEEHKHQARMTRDTLQQVTTPLIFFVEHDMPLCEDIPFKEMSEMILSGKANIVRLMFEAHILEVHKYLMKGREGDYTKTVQWSQRPHLASTEFYRHLMNDYFSHESKTYIEDKLYGAVSEAPWEDFKVWIYTPDGDNKRSYTTDGRGFEPKWDSELVF